MRSISHTAQILFNISLGLILTTVVFLSPFTVSPGSSSPESPWTYADIRALAPADSVSPALDLIALYTRHQDNKLEIRLDLLESETRLDFDLYLALDTQPGGSSTLPIQADLGIDWDILLLLPAGGRPRAVDADGQPVKLLRRVVRDPDQDLITVELSPGGLPGFTGLFQIQALITPPGSPVPADIIGPVSSTAGPPSRAPLLLAFWNTLPSATPAQALRRWDGAHTGPLGGRHGLSQILQAASRYKVPVALLDLKTSTSLSALDYLGGLDQVKDLHERGLLILPDVARGDPQIQAGLADSRRITRAFNLPASPFLFGPLSVDPPASYTSIFAELPGTNSLVRWKNARLIPLPGSIFPSSPTFSEDTLQQVTPEGLTLESRRKLLEAALSPDPADLVSLGGDLPNSNWGDNRAAQAAFAYLAGHPWIQPLNADQLQAFPLGAHPAGLHPCLDWLCAPAVSSGVPTTSWGEALPSGYDAAQIQQILVQELLSSPPGPLTELAWQAYLDLSNPAGSPTLTRLRENYLGQVRSLLYAARWSLEPTRQADCTADVDLDGIPECIMASEKLFLIFKTDGARLLFAFARSSQEVFQIIGPTSQFSLGLGDPAGWQLENGPAADPLEIPGAFSDEPGTWQRYTAEVEPGRITFTAQDQSQKVFSLIDSDIQAEYRGQKPVTIRMPLALAPHARFTPGWGRHYYSEQTQDAWVWGITAGPSIEILTSARLETQTFKDSYPLIQHPEDPDIDYPPGHYLPFPLALAEVVGEGDFTVDLVVRLP